MEKLGKLALLFLFIFAVAQPVYDDYYVHFYCLYSD